MSPLCTVYFCQDEGGWQGTLVGVARAVAVAAGVAVGVDVSVGGTVVGVTSPCGALVAAGVGVSVRADTASVALLCGVLVAVGGRVGEAVGVAPTVRTGDDVEVMMTMGCNVWVAVGSRIVWRKPS